MLFGGSIQEQLPPPSPVHPPPIRFWDCYFLFTFNPVTIPAFPVPFPSRQADKVAGQESESDNQSEVLRWAGRRK